MRYRKNIKRVFISVPFKEKDFTEIMADMSKTYAAYERKQRDAPVICIELTDPVHNYYVPKRVEKEAKNAKHPELIYLSEALRKMANCDDVAFSDEWRNAKGCRVERLVYELYFNKADSE